MSQDTFQDSLFEDPIGLRFRHARERMRWSLESAAQQLKLPVAVLDAIEREDWARLGAPIFVRSYLGSYARLLGLPPGIADEVVRGTPTPQLGEIGSLAASRKPDRRIGGLAAVAIVVLVLLGFAAAFYFGMPGQATSTGSLDATPAIAAAAAADRPAPRVAAQAAVATAPGAIDPNIGSPDASSAQPGELHLEFRGDSWVEVLGPDGLTVERGLAAAGTERRFAAGQVGQITLGDASVVGLRVGGVLQDLSGVGAAKVARFTVSSDGSIHPAAVD
jgi:cytoskeleton protein RodZ